MLQTPVRGAVFSYYLNHSFDKSMMYDMYENNSDTNFTLHINKIKEIFKPV